MSIVYTILSIFLALVGGSIWRFEWTSLLSNVDPATVTNKKGLARWAGACFLALATIAFSVGISLQFITTNRGELIACIAFMISSQLLMVVYLTGIQRYTK